MFTNISLERPLAVIDLYQHFVEAGHMDSDDFFRKVEGKVYLKKGKHRGSLLAAVATSAPDYLEWILGQNFFDDTKAVVRDALATARTV